MEKFLRELELGEIHFRDKWQFELKSEYAPIPELGSNVYTQEFYLFIPNSFHINRSTYSKDQFYSDQTNLIRFKTPEFALKALIDPSEERSPLTHLRRMMGKTPTPENQAIIEDELKLFGNIVRSSLREEVANLIRTLSLPSTEVELEPLLTAISTLCQDVHALRKEYADVRQAFAEKWNTPSITSHFLYIDEFISTAINHYLSGLLDVIRKHPQAHQLKEADDQLSDLIVDEKRHREAQHHEPQKIEEGSLQNEFIFYRGGLLNKFVVDALLLTTNRSALEKRFRNVIGAIAAGIAMLFFLVLWIYQGTVFAINSAPFVLVTVILYILKDRMKEGLKTLSFRQASRWFPDYTTEILSPGGKRKLGTIDESFSFVNESQVPTEILQIRNKQFHAVLERFKRPERVIYYKRTVNIAPYPEKEDPRRHDLNIIFRYNIHHFLIKLANPYHTHTTLDPNSKEFIRTRLPKVYHVNIIMKNTYQQKDQTTKTELRKFRLIMDKSGIKRVEHVH